MAVYMIVLFNTIHKNTKYLYFEHDFNETVDMLPLYIKCLNFFNKCSLKMKTCHSVNINSLLTLYIKMKMFILQY